MCAKISRGEVGFSACYFTVPGRDQACLQIATPGPVAVPAGQQMVWVTVVLDCSGSMDRRIGRANLALKAIYNSPQVAALTVIRFGTFTVAPVTFEKKRSHVLTNFQADCGGTNFIPALQSLETHLRSQQSAIGASQHEHVTVLISDGATSDNPMSFIDNSLGSVLRDLDCPLLSVAITTSVSPNVMVSLSQLHGNLPLVLVKDDDPEMALAERVMEELPLVKAQLQLKFANLRTGFLIHQETQVFRPSTPCLFMSPPAVPFNS